MLPFIVLVFLVTAGGNSTKEINDYLMTASGTNKIVLSTIVAVILMEAVKWLGKADLDVIASVYALFVSTLLAFMLWAFLGKFFTNLGSAILAFIVAGGLHIIFRGLPSWLVDD